MNDPQALVVTAGLAIEARFRERADDLGPANTIGRSRETPSFEASRPEQRRLSGDQVDVAEFVPEVPCFDRFLV